MKRLLFVDDEKNVLDGLRRGLYSMRDEWQMEFADNGKDALSVLEDSDVDALVTDVRMPRMDGFQLLNEAKETCPEVVRVVLSGQTEPEALAHSLDATHIFLTKPCDTEMLKHRVGRILTSGEKIRDASLRSLISQVGVVPSLSMLVSEMTREFNRSEPNIETIGQIVSMDMGMSSAVLHFVNSGYFGPAASTSNPMRAVRWLGLEAVRNLLITNRICTPFDPAGFEYFDALTLWSESISTSTAARAIAMSQSNDGVMAEDAFAAGLFHDVGQVVLAATLGSFYDDVVKRAISSGQPLWKIERELIGSTHAEVGAYLLGLWGLPDTVLNAVTWHHSPDEGGAGQFSALTAAHIADAIGHQRAKVSPVSHALLDEKHLSSLGAHSDIEDWLTDGRLRRP